MRPTRGPESLRFKCAQSLPIKLNVEFLIIKIIGGTIIEPSRWRKQYVVFRGTLWLIGQRVASINRCWIIVSRETEPRAIIYMTVSSVTIQMQMYATQTQLWKAVHYRMFDPIKSHNGSACCCSSLQTWELLNSVLTAAYWAYNHFSTPHLPNFPLGMNKHIYLSIYLSVHPSHLTHLHTNVCLRCV